MTGLLRAAAVVALAATGIAGLLANHPPTDATHGAPGAAAGLAAGSGVLAPARIAGHAHAAGFRGDALTVAVAVALAESGGDPRAHNPKPPDDSYGLWQINMLGRLGPDRRARYGLTTNRDLFDPAVNARVAHAIAAGGRDWSPWATYTHGSYRRHLAKAAQGVAAWQAGERP